MRIRHAAENLAIMPHLALTLLKREAAAQLGIKVKRWMCGWEETGHAQVLVACRKRPG